MVTGVVERPEQNQSFEGDVAVFDDGSFVITWARGFIGGHRQGFYQIFASNGEPISSATPYSGLQFGAISPDITSLEDDEFVIVWNDASNPENTDTTTHFDSVSGEIQSFRLSGEAYNFYEVHEVVAIDNGFAISGYDAGQLGESSHGSLGIFDLDQGLVGSSVLIGDSSFVFNQRAQTSIDVTYGLNGDVNGVIGVGQHYQIPVGVLAQSTNLWKLASLEGVATSETFTVDNREDHIFKSDVGAVVGSFQNGKNFFVFNARDGGVLVRVLAGDDSDFETGNPTVIGSGAVTGSFSVAGLEDGTAIVAWHVHNGTDFDVVGRIIDQNGNAISELINFDMDPRFNQTDVEVAALPDGGFFATWTDGNGPRVASDVEFRVFPGLAVPGGPENLIVNGSFEEVPNTTIYPNLGFYAEDGVLPGWTEASGKTLEVLNTTRGDAKATKGKNWLDLEATPDSIEVYQLVEGVEAGESYRLSFDLNNSFNGDDDPQNLVEVYWAGELLGSWEGTQNVQSVSVDVQGASGENELRFKGAGVEDNFGIGLDNVRLVSSEDRPWASLTDSFDADGVRIHRSMLYDDGRVAETDPCTRQ